MFHRRDFSLRRLTKDDLPLVRSWRNSDRIRANMYTDHLISEEEHQAWFQRLQNDPSNQYFIFENAGRPIGVANVTSLDRENGTCAWAFYLGEADAPRGSGAVMEFLMLDYIFETLGVRKLDCEVFVFNESTVRLHKKFGFREEALYRGHVVKNGRAEDVVALSLLASDWAAVKPKMAVLCFGEAAAK